MATRRIEVATDLEVDGGRAERLSFDSAARTDRVVVDSRRNAPAFPFFANVAGRAPLPAGGQCTR